MCYRYSNTNKKVNTILEKIAVEEMQEKLYFNHTNAFDNRALPIITQQKPNEVQFYNWGLIPHWVKDEEAAKNAAKGNANARSETAFELPSFKSYIPNRRCIIPATGFFEWRHAGKDKIPYHVEVLDSKTLKPRAFFFAGIYSHWQDKQTFSILTTEANELMEYVHNHAKRMPVILSDEDALKWLIPDQNKFEIEQLLVPYNTDMMSAHTISKRITDRKLNTDVPETLQPFDYQLEDAKSEIHLVKS